MHAASLETRSCEADASWSPCLIEEVVSAAVDAAVEERLAGSCGSADVRVWTMDREFEIIACLQASQRLLVSGQS